MPVDMKNLTTHMIVYSNPNPANPTAPTRGYFLRLRIKTTIRIHDGMLCINNPTKVCQNVYPCQKISKENILMKRINTIPAILGNRYKNHLEFFFMYFG